MSRPLLKHRIEELEQLFQENGRDPATIEALRHELQHRSTDRAKQLLARLTSPGAPASPGLAKDVTTPEPVPSNTTHSEQAAPAGVAPPSIPVESDEAQRARRRAKNLFAFLKAYANLRRTVVTALAEEEWSLRLDNLLPHPTIARGRVEGTGESAEPFLRVGRATPTRPPSPASWLNDWLEGAWDDPEREPRFRDIRQTTASTGEIVSQRFDEDKTRLAFAQDWLARWKQWADSERPVERARRLYELGAVVLMSGCASVLGTKQADFSFNTSPQQAQVFVDGNPMGETPLKVKLSNTKAHTITFKKEGYKDTSCQLEKGTGAGWVILDVVTGIVPVVIDAATNNWSQTKSHECTQTLAPMAAASN